MKKRTKILLIIGIIVLTLFIGIVIFRNLSFGLDHIILDKTNGSIEISVPKYSFGFKKSDNNISIKSFQSNRIVKNELDNILSKYIKVTCYEKKYYYNVKDNYTIIDYGINNHFIFNTIYMKYVDYNYCDYLKMDEYSKYINLETLHTMNASRGFILNEENIGKTMVQLIDGISTKENEYQFTIKMQVLYVIKKDQAQVIEDSEGTYEIKDGKLIYYRDKINLAKDESIIPKVSAFTIKDKMLILDDNYLSEYEDEITLE